MFHRIWPNTRMLFDPKSVFKIWSKLNQKHVRNKFEHLSIHGQQKVEIKA